MTNPVDSSNNPTRQASTGNWERQTIEKIALAGLKEQRRTRRWGIFFKILFVVYLTIIVVGIFSKRERNLPYDQFGNEVSAEQTEHIALIRLHGQIAADAEASAEKLSATIRRAVAQPKVKGLLIDANSGGGSPVQSSIVYQAIKQAKADYPSKPIYTVVSDVCASGCYYIVSATDEIYADASSIVGSIGVIAQSFGYGETLSKLGLDARTFTAGENKDFMNPTRPVKAEESAFLEALLDDLHQQFIQAVKEGRGDKLSDDETLFSGLFWTGNTAQSLGLIDGIATPNEVLAKMGDYPVYDYMRKSPVEALLEDFGVEAANAAEKSLQQFMEAGRQISFQ